MSEDPSVPPSEEIAEPGRRPAGAATAARRSSRAGADLSGEIQRVVEREPGDEVRCTRVGGDTYRCNWWSVAGNGGYDNPGMRGGQLATDHRIRKSAFLRVTKGRKGLRITEVP